MRTSFPLRLWPGTLVALALAGMAPAAGDPVEAPLAAARRLWLEGKYAEATDAFRALPDELAVVAALGIARCQEAVGERDKSVETLAMAIKKHPDAAAVPAELARLALERGDLKAAEDLAAAALKLDEAQLLAQWVTAETLCMTGRLDEANAGYQRLVKFFNEHEIRDPDSMQWVGLAAGQYARWNRLSDQFTFLVNEFYPELLSTEPGNWRAHYDAGRLYAEKYNQAEASAELKAALELNPNAAEVHVALGELALGEFEIAGAESAADAALEINPQLLTARHLKADIQLANFSPRQCVGVLNDALKLNPRSEETLGRLAAAYASIDGVSRTGADSRFGKLVAEVTVRNPHPGAFYQALADALDRLRRWPAAAQYYQKAIETMPQLVAAPGKLGMMLMRLGEEEQAKVTLDEAFRIDPFNVRVNNTLKVLEILAGYETLESEHFRIKFDPEKDAVTANYMSHWLEEVYPQLVRQMGFAPSGKSLFEVFSQAKNTDGHGWFSARMVGLPRIHPIGACAGKIVALQSPSEGQQRFNWARVLKHEFVHVINLQQTDFNIPHWFTEALAVLNEGYPRSEAWNVLLVEGLAKERLFNLDTINLGFIRPHSSSEWTLAYCQAELYAQYMLDRFGDDAIAKMLSAYADNLTTPEAIERSFRVPQADFERGYRAFVEHVVAELPTGAKDRELSITELQKALAQKPKDSGLLARLAQVQLGRRSYAEARRTADSSLAVDPQNALAHYVRARLHLLVGENKEALARLERALDREDPQENVLSLLAGLKLKAEDYAAAAELYELGAKHDPGGSRWLKSLAAVYLKSNDTKKLVPVLVQLAESDADDFAVRKKLAQLTAATGEHAAAARWALEALHIDVRDVELHEWRAEALLAQKSPASAAEEYELAIRLDPDALKLRLALAEAWLKANEPMKAKAALAEILMREPEHVGATKLLETIK